MLGAGLQQDHGNLIEVYQSGISTLLFKGAPAQSETLEYGEESLKSHRGRPSLDHLNSLGIVLYVRVPDWCTIFQLGPDFGFISFVPKFRAFGLKVPSQETKGFVGTVCYSGNIGLPRGLLALFVNLVIRGFQNKSLAISTLRYLAESRISSVWS